MITFSLAASPYTAVSISRNPTVDSHFWHRRINQNTDETADGEFATYDGGPTVLEGEIVLEGVSRTQAEALRTWLRSTIIFGLNAFNIAPPSNTDIGAGVGVAVSSLRFNGKPSTEDYIKWSPPDVYSIAFPYRKAI